MTLLDFARGPALQWSVAIFVFGLLWRLVGVFFLRTKVDLSVPRNPATWKGLRLIALRSWPRKEFLEGTAFGEVMGYTFHLGFLVTLAALAVAAAWLLGAAIVGAWRLAWRLRAARPVLARGVPALLLSAPLLGAALALAAALPAGHGCHCELDAALHLCAAHPERSLPLVPPALAVLGAAAVRLLAGLGLALALALVVGLALVGRVVRPLYQLAQWAPTFDPERVVEPPMESGAPAEVRDLVLAGFPDAQITFKPDLKRQAIVDSWPADVDDSAARDDWGLAPRYDLQRGFLEYLIPRIRERYGAAEE